MENTELARVRAEGRVRLLAVVLILLVLAGGVREYMAMQTSGAEATVIYARGNGGAAEQNTVAEAVPAEAQNEAASAEAQNEAVVDGAAQFVDYLNQVNRDLEGVTRPESALEKIVAFEKKAEEPAHEVIFEDGRIEIYDSEAGVIAVEETGVADDETPMQAVKADETVPAVKTEETVPATEEAVSAEAQAEMQATEAQAEMQAMEAQPEGANQPVLTENKQVEAQLEGANQLDAGNNAVENAEESPTQVDLNGEVVENTDENREQSAEEDGAINLMKEIATTAEEEAKQN